MIRESATSSKVSQDAMVKVVESLPEQTGWNIRGLEATIDGGNQKSENKLRGVLAVLMEQDRQDMEDKKPSDIKIAKRYIKATQRCQTAAFLRAIMDRSAVETSFQTKKQSFEQKNVELSRFLQPNALRISPRAA